MKLYATTTSERASKGQGGNKHLQTDILVEKNDRERYYCGTLTVRNDTEQYVIAWTDGTTSDITELKRVSKQVEYLKGKKKKSDN